MYSGKVNLIGLRFSPPIATARPSRSLPKSTGRPRGKSFSASSRENWKANRLSLALVNNIDTSLTATDASGRSSLDILSDDAKEQALAVKENRKKHLRMARLHYEELHEVDKELRYGTLTTEKVFNNKGMIVRAEMKPSIADRVNLAGYAQTIANISYRALGDVAATDKASDPGRDGHVQAPAITIILPGVIAEPRQDRQLKTVSSDSPVIDVTPAAPTQASDQK